MDERKKRQIKNTALSVWKAIKGSLHFRFAKYLIGAGLIALAGPPFAYAIALHVFGMAADQLGYGLNPFWDNVTKGVGVLLILLGIVVFFRGEKTVQPAPDSFDFTIPNGWTFQQTAKTLARGYSLDFEGFSGEELNQSLISREICADNMLEALPLLREALEPTFPDFDVVRENSKILIRKRDDNQETHS